MNDSYKEEVKAVSKRIKQLRIEKGYTSYEQFATEHGIQNKQYWKIEEAKVDYRMTTLFRVLECLEISPEKFFKGFNEPKE